MASTQCTSNNIQDVPEGKIIVERQRKGEGPVLDSYHDEWSEALAHSEFLALDRNVETRIIRPRQRRAVPR